MIPGTPEPTYTLEWTASTLAFVRRLIGQQPHDQVASLTKQIEAEVAKQDQARQEQLEKQLREKYGGQRDGASDAT